MVLPVATLQHTAGYPRMLPRVEKSQPNAEGIGIVSLLTQVEEKVPSLIYPGARVAVVNFGKKMSQDFVSYISSCGAWVVEGISEPAQFDFFELSVAGSSITTTHACPPSTFHNPLEPWPATFHGMYDVVYMWLPPWAVEADRLGKIVAHLTMLLKDDGHLQMISLDARTIWFEPFPEDMCINFWDLTTHAARSSFAADPSHEIAAACRHLELKYDTHRISLEGPSKDLHECARTYTKTILPVLAMSLWSRLGQPEEELRVLLEKAIDMVQDIDQSGEYPIMRATATTITKIGPWPASLPDRTKKQSRL